MVDVKLPGIGEVPRGGVIAGVLLGGGVGVYLYMKHKSSAATAPAATAAGYGYGTGYGYGINAGYGYGYGQFQAGETYGYGLGIASAGYGTGVAGYGYGYQPTSPSPGPTTNALWLTDAESALDATHSPATVSAALGKYLAGGTLTSDQAQIVSAAIAAVGDPPVPGPDGYPPAVHSGTPGGQTKPGSGTGPETGHRHIASGRTSLNRWATINKTTSGEVINTTEKNYQSGYMTTANHTKFDQYLNGGTTRTMPIGLVYFSVH